MVGEKVEDEEGRRKKKKKTARFSLDGNQFIYGGSSANDMFDIEHFICFHAAH